MCVVVMGMVHYVDSLWRSVFKVRRRRLITLLQLFMWLLFGILVSELSRDVRLDHLEGDPAFSGHRRWSARLLAS